MIELPDFAGHADALWNALLDLRELVPGGTQALQRAERVTYSYKGRVGSIPRPSLIGAIVGKACGVDVDDVPTNQEIDLALLLSLVVDPFELREH